MCFSMQKCNINRVTIKTKPILRYRLSVYIRVKTILKWHSPYAERNNLHRIFWKLLLMKKYITNCIWSQFWHNNLIHFFPERITIKVALADNYETKLLLQGVWKIGVIPPSFFNFALDQTERPKLKPRPLFSCVLHPSDCARELD